MLELSLIVLVSVAAGLAVFALTARLSGARGRRRSGRRVRARDLTLAISQAIPQTARSRTDSERALARAGVRVSPASLWGARVACLAAGLAAGAVVASAPGATFAQRVACLVLGVAIGAVAPQAYLLRRRSLWRDEIERELPGALDLLTICVQAGATFESGLRTVANRSQGALADALSEVVQASAFMPTTQALSRLASTAGVRSLTVFVASLAQAERAGIQLVDVLRSQADSVRAQRRLALEEQINQLPLKMTFPLVLIFASLVLLLMSPVVAELFAGLTTTM